MQAGWQAGSRAGGRAAECCIGGCCSAQLNMCRQRAKGQAVLAVICTYSQPSTSIATSEVNTASARTQPVAPGLAHRVGSGTGPAMVAPVLLAASRIFSTESCSRSTQ